jgi:UDP-glucose 4-epimerase
LPAETVSWRGRSVLVTGADGFIGSHLAEALAGLGARVTALACYNSFDSFGWLDDLAPAVRGALRLVRGDVRDGPAMARLVAGHQDVFHLAALIAIPHSYEAPSSYVATNVQGTVNLLEAARGGRVERFVHTSTSEVYGTARRTRIDEDHPLQGQSPYAASKIAADMMAESFARSFDLPVVTLRPFNTFGPRQSERAVIGATIRQALDPGCATIRLGNLAPKREFNFVADTVAAFLAVAGLAQSHRGQVFNAGCGRMVAIGEMVERVRAIVGTQKPIEHEPARVRPEGSEVMALMADAGRLAAATGWRAKASFEDGLAETVRWWRGRLDRLRPGAEYMT